MGDGRLRALLDATQQRPAPAVLVVGDSIREPNLPGETWHCVAPVPESLLVRFREHAMERLPKTRGRKRSMVERLACSPRLPPRLRETLIAAVEGSACLEAIARAIGAKRDAAHKLVARLRDWFDEPRLERLVDDVDEALCGRGPLLGRLQSAIAQSPATRSDGRHAHALAGAS